MPPSSPETSPMSMLVWNDSQHMLCPQLICLGTIGHVDHGKVIPSSVNWLPQLTSTDYFDCGNHQTTSRVRMGRISGIWRYRQSSRRAKTWYHYFIRAYRIPNKIPPLLTCRLSRSRRLHQEHDHWSCSDGWRSRGCCCWRWTDVRNHSRVITRRRY